MTMRSWFIEVRADFANKEKNDIFDEETKNKAADLHALGTLLSDGARVEVICYSDDFMAGHRELDWLAAKKAATLQGDTAVVTEDDTQTPVSDEMVEALNELRKHRGG